MNASLELGLILFTFLVLAPCIAAVIGYAAWKGKPKSFDREMYWTAFVAIGAAAALPITYALRHPTWPRLAQLACLGLGAMLLSVAMGFGIGIFTRKASSLPD